MSQHQSGWKDERRTYFRVDDDVYLEYLILSGDEIQNAIAEFRSDTHRHFNPLNQLQAITIRNRGVLDKIRTQWPDIGAYLLSIDERIQLLAHAIAQDQVGVPIVPNETVNLSGGGLSFGSEQGLEPGTSVEFSIIIVPSYLHICALGNVVYCRHDGAADPTYPYRIGVEFSHIHDADREALLRHVQEKQSGARADTVN